MPTQDNLSFAATYEILGEIGKGGGGTVYKAYHKRLQKVVVLKRIHGNLTSINARNEADILKNLKSAYLPQVLDFIEQNGCVYTVMEYIEGASFEQVLTQNQWFAQAVIVRWFWQLAEALLVLHTQNPPIIHGDIKPANVMLLPSGDICLIDFNVSSIFDGRYDHITGYTPAYAAPEQILFYQQALSAITTGGGTAGSMGQGGTDARRNALYNMQATIDTRTDIYSLGATIYHIITGVRPRGQDGYIRHIREFRSDIDESLIHIVEKCLAVNPNERFANAWELSEALNNVYRSTSAYRGLVVRQRVCRLLLLAGTIGFLLLTAFGFRITKQERTIAYNTYVNQEADARETGDEGDLEKAFKKAIALDQGRSDAYVEKGWYLYDRGAYEEGLRFLLEEAIPYVLDKEGLSDLYLLAGMDADSLGTSSQAEELFQKAIKANPDNSKAYQEFAILLAKNQQVPEAERALEHAIDKGLSNSGIAYTEGEIAFAKGDYSEAERAFTKAKEETKDAYMEMRACLMLAEIYKVTEETPEKQITLLEEMVQEVAAQYRPVVTERLAQAYIERYEKEGNEADAEKAVVLLQGIAEEGFGNFTTYETMIRLLQKERKFDEEEALLAKMREMFGEDYRIDMYSAYAELLQQNEAENSKRDYGQFKAYYDRALALYEGRNVENASDPLMENLKDSYQQVMDGGWLQ
ncbi:MAG: protein kinase [Lachnospiraceae bacterium]|nr:protein kinase [Lachnospiraceae bacterium]